MSFINFLASIESDIKNNTFKYMISTALAYFSLCSLYINEATYEVVLKNQSGLRAIISSIGENSTLLSIIALVVFTVVIRYSFDVRTCSNRLRRFLAIVSFLLSLSFSINGSIEMVFSNKLLLITTCFKTFVFGLFTYRLSLILSAFLRSEFAGKLFKRTCLISKCQFCTVEVLKLSIFIFLFWIPVLIANGPAIVGIDSMVQLIQARGFPAWDPMTMLSLKGFALSDHHPFFDSLIYGAFDRFGMLIGNEIIGMSLLIWLQSFVAAVSLATAILWVKSRTSCPDALICVFVCLSCSPVFSSYMTIVLKDSTWVSIFLIWFICYLEICYRYFINRSTTYKLFLLLFIFTILSALTKKTSVYVTTVALLLLGVFIKPKIPILTTAFSTAVIVLILIPKFLFPVLMIAPGGPQETLAVPIQQITKLVIDHRDAINDRDLKAIEKVLDIDAATENWRSDSTDYAKHYGYRVNCSKQDRTNFLMVWIKYLFKYPVSYLSAIPFITDSFVGDSTYYYSGPVRLGWYEAGGYALFTSYGEGEMSFMQEHFGAPLEFLLNSLPMFSFVGAESLYTFVIPVISFAFVFYKKDYRKLIFLIPIFLLLGIQFLIPAHQVRYSLGLLYCTALTVAVSLFHLRESGVNNNRA